MRELSLCLFFVAFARERPPSERACKTIRPAITAMAERK
jgi:hypothetical protein